MRLRLLKVLPCLLVLAAMSSGAWGAESLLRAGDVIALVGGEEMVTAAEAGELELALTLAAPELQLHWRSLAWEGDTVYAQRRDLNYPTLAQQLEQCAAKVVFVQFGQMESLDGAPQLPKFIAAYESLLQMLCGGGKRRLVLLLPHSFMPPPEELQGDLTIHNEDVEAYAAAIRQMAQRQGWVTAEWTFAAASAVTDLTRDGVHLNQWGERLRALSLVSQVWPSADSTLSPTSRSPATEDLLRLIQQKNRLWFNYYRPQNWAFLAGDRTNQPSSRDHLDPAHRWFPEEMEQYLPLVARQEEAIWKAAAPTHQP